MVKKVLIVDDEKDISSSVKMLVDKLGYSSKTVNDGESALASLKKEKFDLVLLDILMPRMSGREVLEKIRADSKLKNQKVAFLSVVQLSPGGQGSIKKLNPVAYFQKPIVDIDDFKSKLKGLLAKS
jgi:CheY-like chemotaxis protein